MEKIGETIDEQITLSPSGPAKEIYIYPVNSMPGISMTASFIIDSLKDWNKKLQKHGSKDSHPSYLLTIDKLGSALGAYSNLSTQGRSDEAISEALRQIMDLKDRGRNKIAYLYPFLFKDNNKIAVKYPLFIPQNELRSDARPFRNLCFSSSLEMVNLLLKNRSEKTKTATEENPGELIIHKNKAGHEWLFPKVISLESEINGFLKKGFAPFQYIPQNDFMEDFILHAKNQGAVTEILPDYHIIVDDLKLNPDGSFKEPPELVFHYRTQADGLLKFALKFLKEFAVQKKYDLYLHKLTTFETEDIANAPKGQKQNRELISRLIALIEDYPFDAESPDLEKRVKEVLDESVKIVRKLMDELDHISSRKHENLLEKLVAELPEAITKNTKNSLTLLEINLREELIKAGVHEENLDKSIQEVKAKLAEKCSFHEMKDSDTIFAVDQGYMAAVLHKLSCSSPTDLLLKRQYAIAKLINARISNPKHPDLNSKLQPDQIVRLHEDVRNNERLNQQKSREMNLKRKFNSGAAMAAFLAVLLIFLIFSIHLDTLAPVYIGMVMGAVAAFIAGRFFRVKSEDETGGRSSVDNDESGSDLPDVTTGKDDKLAKIARSAETYIFPKRFNNISEKIYHPKSLKSAIFNNIAQIRTSNDTLMRETDLDKVATTIEYALMQNVVTISIPDELVPKNKPNAVIIHMDDLKAAMIREQIADYYRSEAEKSVYDRQLVKYYTFLINTIEMEYYKYLPGRKR